jgi:hypothetical protein
VQKVKRLTAGRFVGGSTLPSAIGHRPLCVAAYEWLQEQREKPDPVDEGEFGAIVVAPDGTVYRVSSRMEVFEGGEAPFHADGAPVEFLYGALYAGASAVEAVKLAIDFTDGAWGAVQAEIL